MFFFILFYFILPFSNALHKFSNIYRQKSQKKRWKSTAAEIAGVVERIGGAWKTQRKMDNHHEKMIETVERWPKHWNQSKNATKTRQIWKNLLRHEESEQNITENKRTWIEPDSNLIKWGRVWQNLIWTWFEPDLNLIGSDKYKRTWFEPDLNLITPTNTTANLKRTWKETDLGIGF